MTLSRLLRQSLVGCVVFVGALATGRGVVTIAMSRERPPPSDSTDPGRSGVPIHARIDPGLRERLAREVGDPSLVLLLRADDLRSCEDMGRQLRELRRDAWASLPAIALTDSASVPAVRAFLRREKLAIPLRTDPAMDLPPNSNPLPSPAAMRVQEGRAEGIAFPRRVPGVRTYSFAQALVAAAPLGPEQKPAGPSPQVGGKR